MEKNGSDQRLFSEVNVIMAKSYKEQAYELLKNAILFRKMEEGTVYSQDGICKELGISRTPVREALLELQNEGYISILRGRGIVVVPISREEIRDILEMRFFLEKTGSRLAARRATPAQLDALRQNVEQMAQLIREESQSNLYKVDRSFHRLLFEAARNDWMKRSLEALHDRYMRVDAWMVFSDKNRGEIVVQEHRKIMDAISRRDPDGAEAAMVEHLKVSYERNVPGVYDFDFDSEITNAFKKSRDGNV